MNIKELPEDLKSYLGEGKNLEYDISKAEPGWVGLNKLGDLELGVVWVNSDESPLKDDDPHAGEDGYYEIPAISLTGECEAYEPEYILLYLPNEGLYGNWDCDHWDLMVFPNVSWTDIVNDPLTFINAGWLVLLCYF